MEENDISIVYSKYNCPSTAEYSPYTRRHSPDKYTIQAGKIGNLLPPIGKQDHETRNPRSTGPYQTNSRYRKL
jgi:hypothetical protein